MAKLKEVIITPACAVQIIGASDRWETIGHTLYTPRHINQVLQAKSISGAWILTAWGREYWSTGKQIATHSAA